jgi:sulfur carrier protein ThiS
VATFIKAREMLVEVEGRERKAEGATVEELMASLGVSPEEYVAVLNGQVVTELEAVPPGSRLKLVRVWSGG